MNTVENKTTKGLETQEWIRGRNNNSFHLDEDILYSSYHMPKINNNIKRLLM